MCRHDDLTTMLLGKEIPRINHPALDAIYEFAIEVRAPPAPRQQSSCPVAAHGPSLTSWEPLA